MGRRKSYSNLSLLRFPLRSISSIKVANRILAYTNFLRRSPGIISRKVEIDSYDGKKIDIYIYKKRRSRGNLPVLIYYHGGGFFLRGSLMDKMVIEHYVKKANLAVIYVDYRVSVDHPYPIPNEDSFSVYKWAISRGKEFGLDPERIFFEGYSAGGALAISTVLMARDRGLSLPKGVILKSPVTDHNQSTFSARTFKDTPVWDSISNKFMWDLFLREVNGDIPHYASPLKTKDLSFFPKTYIEIAEFDPLHDEGLLLGNRLMEFKREVYLNDTKGTNHSSPMAIWSKRGKKSFKIIKEFIF